MAFYHVNGCDCPTGCCDCGDSRLDRRNASIMTTENFHKPSPILKGKCTGCGLKSKKLICWRCETVLEREYVEEEQYG